MSLFDGLPIEPLAVPVQPITTELPYLVTLKRASNGAEILLCNVTPPPAAALSEARSRKLPLFTYDEIDAIRRAGADDPAYVDALVEARRVMGWGGPITFQMETA